MVAVISCKCERASCHWIMSFISSKSSYSLTQQIKSQSTIYFNNTHSGSYIFFIVRWHDIVSWCCLSGQFDFYIKNSIDLLEKSDSNLNSLHFRIELNWHAVLLTMLLNGTNRIRNEIVTLKFASAGRNAAINIKIDSNRYLATTVSMDFMISLFIDKTMWISIPIRCAGANNSMVLIKRP